MPNYNQSWDERIKNEFFRNNIANIFETTDSGRTVYDSRRLNGMTIDEVVAYINLEHNAIDTLTELTDTNISGTTQSDMLYYSGTKWENSQELPLDIHIKSTSGSREIKIESTSGTTSAQSLKFKQPDVEWKIEHSRAGNTSAGLQISDGSNNWKFETTGALKLNSLNSEPANHSKGSIYFNNSDNNFYVALSNTESTP